MAIKPLEALTSAFINTFGITRPSEHEARRVSWFIVALLGLVLIVFFLAIALALHILNRR